MFRIRIVPDDNTPANAASVRQVQQILKEQFPLLSPDEIESLPGKLRDPIKYRFRPILMVAEDASDSVRGFALLLHAPDVGFCYLDFVAAAAGKAGGGIGGALYDRVREEALVLKADGLFFECLPDDPELSPDPDIRKQNADRLAFYERYGARPIAGTAYETPLNAGDSDPPYLVFDPLGHASLPTADRVKKIVRAILERKYGDVCPPEYNKKVIESFQGDTIRLRPPRYGHRAAPKAVRPARKLVDRILLTINDKHDIHHIRERGYVEAPARVGAILREIEKTGLFERREPRRFADRHILAVHDGRLVDYLRRACAVVGDKKSVYPYVFPIRNAARPPQELPLRSGYFCIDTFTPINGNAWLAARRAVDCALTCAERIVEGQRFAYALVRPPGHHAERRAFGGFCYFNNAAVAANYLGRYGRVAVLDIDYHHGNGTQNIFYERGDVLTISIHGHPRFAYPYFTGFDFEQGAGPGAGYNVNIPMPETITADQFRESLAKALRRVSRFRPAFLVIAAGFDTAAGDPTGTWPNRGDDFERIGYAIGAAGFPTLIVQEGGYRVRTLGTNVRRFFEGLWRAGSEIPLKKGPKETPASTEKDETVNWRMDVRKPDKESVRALIATAGVFTTEESSVAVELIDERIAKGAQSGYEFIMAELSGRLIGFACYGPIPGTDRRYDLYWLAVHADFRHQGLGHELLERVEAEVIAAGGHSIWVDTSATDAYASALRLYRDCGYRQVAELPEFFRKGDSKKILTKPLRS